MSKINQIEKAILELEGGAYQKLMDAYLYKRFSFTNFTPLGSQEGTNKTTKGVPDSYVSTKDGKYIFIMYGTVSGSSYAKIEKDILGCLDESKTKIKLDEIEEIICCYTSTNITPEQNKKLLSYFESTVLIGLAELAKDLYFKYPKIAKDFLNVSIDTHQIFEEIDFIEEYDKSRYTTPLNMDIIGRESETQDLLELLEHETIILLYGKSGIGKTKLSLETSRKFAAKNNMILKIIRSNGEPIYDDLNTYFEVDKNYIVLVDDANQLVHIQHLLNMIFSSSERKFKLLLTVRDYAKEVVYRRISSITKPAEYVLKPMEDDKIKEILRSNLQITNTLYIDQIIKIAKGNIRLAVMAGICSVNGSFENIRNSFDIFNSFFSDIFNEMSKQEILVISLLAFFYTTKLESDEIIFKIAAELKIEYSLFIDICTSLHEKEVVDIYDNLAVKFQDQNLSDYVLYYVFFKNKWLKPSDIIIKTFPEFRGRITHTFSTLIQLFNTDENNEYLCQEIKMVWDFIREFKPEICWDFLEAFHALLMDETLLYIKHEIDSMNEEHIDFETFDFKKNSNYHNINSKYLRVLCSFKHTELMPTALELILAYLEKNTSHPMDFYFIFTEVLGIDPQSHLLNYQSEKSILLGLIDYYKCKKP